MLAYAGRLSDEPYYIKEININVYSLEELNFFVYNHMNLVCRDFFCAQLYEYIEKELDRAPLAASLRTLEAQGASLRSFISCFLKESCCYEDEQLGAVSAYVMNIDNITEPERIKTEADKLYEDERYNAALGIYLEILKDSKGLEGEFYAETAFAAGCCYAHLFLCENACEYFSLAYDIYPKHEYIISGACLSMILENEQELLKTIIRYKISDEELSKIQKDVERLKRKVSSAGETALFMSAAADPKTAQEITEGYKDEYYRMTE